MLGNHFLMETRIICLIKRGLNLWSRNKWDLSTIVSTSSSNKFMLKYWNWSTLITDFLNLEENTFAYKRIYLWRKKRFEELDTKFSRDGRNEESARITSRRILFKNWEKVVRQMQSLTSQMHEMQEQMNSMNDSEEFQEVESNHTEKLYYVPCQPAAIPSSRSMLSRNKRLPLDTWKTCGLQENVFGKQFSTIDASRNHYQRIHHSMTPGASGSVAVHIGTGTPAARDEDLNRSTIPMPTIARRPSDHKFIKSRGYSSEFPGWTAKTANIGTAVRKIPYTFYILMLEDKIQKPYYYWFRFSIGGHVVDQKK